MRHRHVKGFAWNRAAPSPFGLVVEHIKEERVDTDVLRVNRALLPPRGIHDGDCYFGFGCPKIGFEGMGIHLGISSSSVWQSLFPKIFMRGCLSVSDVSSGLGQHRPQAEGGHGRLNPLLKPMLFLGGYPKLI